MLIGAVWLLMLCAGISGLMMLRSVEAARAQVQAERAFRDQLLQGAAAETAKAGRLFDGQRSRWWNLPASGTEKIDEVEVTITLGQSDLSFIS